MSDNLWFTDNGAVLCTEHLGSSAKATGRDISGQKIERVTAEDREEFRATVGREIGCESCRTQNSPIDRDDYLGRSLSLSLLADDIEAGRFTPTRISPNGTASWLVFGAPGSKGTDTANGPRRVVVGLTSEVEAVTGLVFVS